MLGCVLRRLKVENIKSSADMLLSCRLSCGEWWGNICLSSRSGSAGSTFGVRALRRSVLCKNIYLGARKRES